MRHVLVPALLSLWAVAPSPQEAAPPKPTFQGDFFGEMPRAFGVIQSVDPKERRVTAKLDGIFDTLSEVFGLASEQHIPSSDAAVKIAKRRLDGAPAYGSTHSIHVRNAADGKAKPKGPKAKAPKAKARKTAKRPAAKGKRK